MKVFLILVLSSISLYSLAYTPNKDWINHNICQYDSRLNQRYCLDLVEIQSAHKKNEGVVLLIPGLTHNAHIFDLIPEKGVSLARYLELKFKLKVYILNIRLVGNSTYIRNSNLDDIAIDDVSKTIDFLYSKEKQKIIIIGHSQGAITLNASLSGLSRCGEVNCFKKSVASLRQAKVKSIGLLAGDTRLKMEKTNPVYKLSGLIQLLKPSLFLYDRLNLETLTYLFHKMGYLDLWRIIVNEDNVSGFAKSKLLEKSVSATSMGILDQFSQGVLRGDIRSLGGESYADNSKNLVVPVYQQVYGIDWLSPAQSTMNDSFKKIGSKEKEIELFNDQGHEDFLINAEYHRNLDTMLDFLL